MTMITPDSEVRGGTADAELFAAVLQKLSAKIEGRHGRHSAWMMWRVTAAMLDHESGIRRGITMKTWQRYVGMLLQDADACLTIWFRLQNNAHWNPLAAA